MGPHIIYIMGVSGSGKTTIGRKLSEKTTIPFFDADEFHPAVNIEKMKSGHPLTDEDRAGWLLRINELAKSEMVKAGAIIACSALKEKYRAILSGGITVPLVWVFLDGNYDLLLKRMQSRKGHFMPPGMLWSQFDVLEKPGNAITVDVADSPDAIVENLIARINE
jgi:gluconokinase